MSIIRHIALVATLLVGTASADIKADPNADLAARRAHAISWLHDYRVKGVFPTDEIGVPRSVFLDKHGVRCPMAELIHDAGHDELVTAVYLKANDLRLADVHAGPLFDWMLHSGLTLEEIDMVQGMMTMNEMETVLASRDPAQARATVARRLINAVKALRANTKASLVIAASELAKPHVVTGPVVSDSMLEVTTLRRMATANPRRDYSQAIARAAQVNAQP